MAFMHYWAILQKRWKIVLSCFLIAGSGALIGSKLIPPTYQSTVIIQVAIHSGNDVADINSLLASDQLVQTEAQLATSDPILREVASHYKGITFDQIVKEVTSTPKLNTQLFNIDVEDSDPNRAAAIGNDVAATLIKQQMQLFQQDAAQGGGFLLIAQPAQPNLRPVRPNISLNVAVGCAAGLFLGLLLAWLFEQLDTNVRTREDLTQLLNWPVLATIWQTDTSKKDIINPPANSINIEPYRILRTNIGFSSIDKPLRCIMVTSATSQEGKSVVAANLAISMARAGKNTLLIDADLRKPTLYEKFGLLPDTLGLSNAIMAFSQYQPPYSVAFPNQNNFLEPFIHSIGIPNLRVMPSGPLPPHPPDLLDSMAMNNLLTTLINCGAETIIIDTPPLLGLSDGNILASKMDGTLVVVDVTRAKKDNLIQMKALLTQSGAKVLGSIINRQHQNRKDYYFQSVSAALIPQSQQ